MARSASGGRRFDGAQRCLSGIRNVGDDRKRERADEIDAIQHDIDKLQLKADTGPLPPAAPMPDALKNDLTALASSVNEIDKIDVALAAPSVLNTVGRKKPAAPAAGKQVSAEPTT